ncbi:hypothetical protein OEA41_000258 [Lepraria neglecta]|uniref:Uncharacterized protein n=1 Tax=Lepraria neglecta TaxID=209136 RepID=A0AAD9ZG45_9LECA|nr:hypothetical protein OEA41_000258 [Lepraria neglecta]
MSCSQSQSYLLDQQCRYIGKFNVWEVEELITVYDYLLTWLESSYDPTSAVGDLDRDLTQEGRPTTDDQSSVHQHQSTTNDNHTTNEQHLLDEPQIDQDAALDADHNLFKRQIKYQLSPNEYVEGFDLGDYTLDIGLAEALEHLDKTCKKNNFKCLSDMNPEWKPAKHPYGERRLPARGNEHSIVSYESKGLEAMRVVGGMFFDSNYGSDEQSDTEDGEEEEEEFVRDWDDWYHFHDSKTAEFVCKARRAISVVTKRIFKRRTVFARQPFRSAMEVGQWMTHLVSNRDRTEPGPSNRDVTEPKAYHLMLRICDMGRLMSVFGWLRDVFSTSPVPSGELTSILEDAKLLGDGEIAFEFEKSYVEELDPEESYLEEPELDEESDENDDQSEPADALNTEGS